MLEYITQPFLHKHIINRPFTSFQLFSQSLSALCVDQNLDHSRKNEAQL